jgi:hypothetical protein
VVATPARAIVIRLSSQMRLSIGKVSETTVPSGDLGEAAAGRGAPLSSGNDPDCLAMRCRCRSLRHVPPMSLTSRSEASAEEFNNRSELFKTCRSVRGRVTCDEAKRAHRRDRIAERTDSWQVPPLTSGRSIRSTRSV